MRHKCNTSCFRSISALVLNIGAFQKRRFPSQGLYVDAPFQKVRTPPLPARKRRRYRVVRKGRCLSDTREDAGARRFGARVQCQTSPRDGHHRSGQFPTHLRLLCQVPSVGAFPMASDLCQMSIIELGSVCERAGNSSGEGLAHESADGHELAAVHAGGGKLGDEVAEASRLDAEEGAGAGGARGLFGGEADGGQDEHGTGGGELLDEVRSTGAQIGVAVHGADVPQTSTAGAGCGGRRGAQISLVCQLIFHGVVTPVVCDGCGGRSKSGGANQGSFLQFAPPEGDAASAGSKYYSQRGNLFCFCGLLGGVETGRRIWTVLWKRCVSRDCDGWFRSRPATVVLIGCIKVPHKKRKPLDRSGWCGFPVPARNLFLTSIYQTDLGQRVRRCWCAGLSSFRISERVLKNKVSSLVIVIFERADSGEFVGRRGTCRRIPEHRGKRNVAVSGRLALKWK